MTDRYLLRGELEECKDRLNLLYYDFKTKTQSLHEKVFYLIDLKTRTLQEEVESTINLLRELHNIKQDILLLEERKEYLERRLKEVK